MENLYTVREVSKMLKTSVPTIWRWIYSGELKSYKIGGLVRVPESAIEKRIKDHPTQNKAGKGDR